MMHMEDESDIAFDDLVQQQFLLCKEKTSRKFIQLEELIELAEQKLSLLMSIQVKEPEERFANAFGWKAKVKRDSVGQHPGVITDSSCHFELRLPKLEEGEVSECLQDKEHQLADFSIGYKTQECSNPADEENAYAAYTGEPIYDEEQGEGQEYWPEQEFILAALNKDNLYAPNPLQSEIGKSERSEELEDYQEHPRYDEVPGENKKDWHSEEIICIALGLEDFFEPKKNLEEGNSNGARALECISYFVKPSPSVSPAAVASGPRKIHDEVGSVGNLSREQVELFGVKCLFDCSLETKLFDKSTKRNTVLIAENKIGDEWNNSINLTKEESKEQSNIKLWSSRLVSGHGDMLNIVGSYGVEEKQGANRSVSTMITTNRGEISEAFHSKMTIKDFPTADNSYRFSKKSGNIGEKNVVTFDPGDYVQNDQSKCVTKKLNEAVLIISINGELRHSKDNHLKFLEIDRELSQLRIKVSVVLIVNSDGTQGQDVQKVCGYTDRIISEINRQYVDSVRTELNVIHYRYNYIFFGQCSPEINMIMRQKNHKAWEGVTITIFDPGGFLSCFHGVRFVGGSVGILNIQIVVQVDLNGNASIAVKALPELYLTQVGGSCEVRDPP